MSAAAVLGGSFGFTHNRHRAAAQDYELAKIEYQAVCDGFDGTDERSIGRFHAACWRRREAWERLWFYKFAD